MAINVYFSTVRTSGQIVTALLGNGWFPPFCRCRIPYPNLILLRRSHYATIDATLSAP